ncbi:MAG: molecular chaperone TorD family protein [Chloroflexi bacterium]|nr:molecular chaperone TorD family protein [Chloroflexota bacterium]
MEQQETLRRLGGLLSDVLDYPQGDLRRTVSACERLAAEVAAGAVTPLALFRIWLEETPAGRVEEVYTATFDLDVSRCLYTGYHLFGETYQRSLFLIGLKEWFAAAHFSCEGELPDHLAVLLRFLAVCDDGDRRNELIQDALLPALTKILAASTGGENKEVDRPLQTPYQPDGNATSPYLRVLQGLQVVLEQWPRLVTVAAPEEGDLRV